MSHFLSAQEIFSLEIQALQTCLNRIQPIFDEVIEALLKSKGKIILTGIGKSGHIARKISATLSSTGSTSLFLNASEALHGDLGMVSKGDVVLMLSKSGTTLELNRMLPTLKHLEVLTIGIFGNTQTPLATSLDYVLDGSVDREACPLNLAPTSSTTVALVIGDAIAGALIRAKKFTADQFALFHPAGQLGRNLLLKVSDVMHVGDSLPRATRKATLNAILLEITRCNLGAVCILSEKETLEGIITDGDIRRLLQHSPDLSMLAESFMSTQPICLQADMSLMEALQTMENPYRPVYIAPVTDSDGKCIGMIRMHDILQAGR